METFLILSPSLTHFNHALEFETLELNFVQKEMSEKSESAKEWQVSICPSARERHLGNVGISSLILNLSTMRWLVRCTSRKPYDC